MAFFHTIIAHTEHIAEMEDYLKLKLSKGVSNATTEQGETTIFSYLGDDNFSRPATNENIVEELELCSDILSGKQILVTAEDERTAVNTARNDFKTDGERGEMNANLLEVALYGIESYSVRNDEGTVIGWKISSF